VTAQERRARFAAVAMPYPDEAFRLARWLTGSRTDAEDVVQDAFLRAFSAVEGFAGGNARAWVLTIVRRTCYTWLAKNRPRSLVAVDDLEAVERDNLALAAAEGRTVETPETALIAAEAGDPGERVRAAVARLPPVFREALTLREFEGLSYREIAAILNIPLGTVMSRLARARSLLLKAVAEESP
jgi:RNA polymerase sigma-70 factor, ECF subfamily